MRELNYALRQSKGERVTIMTICVLTTVLLGWVSVFSSGAHRQNVLLAPHAMGNLLSMLMWTMFYIISGVSLFLIISESSSAKRWSIVLWATFNVLSLAFPYIFYTQRLYILSFIWAALIASSIAALIVLCIKHKPLASFLCVGLLVFSVYLNYITLFAAVA